MSCFVASWEGQFLFNRVYDRICASSRTLFSHRKASTGESIGGQPYFKKTRDLYHFWMDTNSPKKTCSEDIEGAYKIGQKLDIKCLRLIAREKVITLHKNS